MAIPPLNALKCFETVARLGSFKAAAAQLCVTQSAVSHQIKKVEIWFGDPLFARESTGVRLLPQAEALSHRLSLAFGEIENACAEAVGSAGQPLVIAAIPSVAMCWLIPRLPEFRAAHPDVDLQIVYARHGERPNFKSVDVAITFDRSPPDLPLVESRLFLSGDCLPVCRRDLLGDRPQRPVKAQDYRALGLLHDTDRAGWSAWLDHPAPLPGPVFEDFNMLRSAVLSGQGIALCPLAMIGPDLEAGHLIALADSPRAMGSDYYMSTHLRAGRVLQPQIAIFRDWAMAQVGVGEAG